MFSLPKAEFYITNVCNLNCTNCNRFNNFAFSGHESWSEHKELYRQWSRILTFEDRIGILGGEPMLNPEFMDWVKGLLELWPDTLLNVVSNGTQLGRWPELYEVLRQNKTRMSIRFSIHGPSLKKSTMSAIENFLQGPIYKRYDRQDFPDRQWQKMWSIIRGPDWPDCDNAEDFYKLPQHIIDECDNQHDLGPQLWTDANGVTVQVTVVNYFVTSSIIPNYDLQNFQLHNSDPQQAVNNCMNKYCHHFSRGRLYKCGVTGLLPDFDDQFFLDISEQDRELIRSYRAAEPTWDASDLETFLHNLRRGKPVAQCKFCPETYSSTRFDAVPKKIKFVKKNPISKHTNNQDHNNV